MTKALQVRTNPFENLKAGDKFVVLNRITLVPEDSEFIDSVPEVADIYLKIKPVTVQDVPRPVNAVNLTTGTHFIIPDDMNVVKLI